MAGAKRERDGELDLIIDECRRGSQSAWRELFRRHFRLVHRVARSMGTPDDEVDDVVQQVFLVAFRKLRRFRGGRFSTWIYRITANVAHQHHRRRRYRAVFGALLAREPAGAPATPEASLERTRARRRVHRILARMGRKKREVFALYELEGLSGEEIATLLGCPVETVRSRLHYARKEFARLAARGSSEEVT